MTCQFREGNENRRSVPWSLPSPSRRPLSFPPARVLPLTLAAASRAVLLSLRPSLISAAVICP